MSGYDLKSEEEVKEYLKNLRTEYTFGCFSEKNPEVCHLLGDYHEAIDKDFAKAASIYQKNCDNFDYGRSCAKFGGWCMVGRGCERDLPKALEYMKKGCEKGDQIGCTNAGVVSTTMPQFHEKDKRGVIMEGIKMLKMACEKKTEKACFFLSGLYKSGIEGFVPKNARESYRFSLQSCEYGNPVACSNVAYMHSSGDGAQKDEKLADTFKKRAIDLDQQIREARQIEMGQGIKIS